VTDAVIVGSGPNGLAAGIRLAQAGAEVLVIEGHAEIGGGTRTAELTLPGFRHDVCSAAHPTGILSPYLRTLPLEAHGLKWIQPRFSVAHPLDDGPAVLLHEDLEQTVAQLGPDAGAYRRLMAPLLKDPHGLLEDLLAPLRVPKHPIQLLRFGLRAIRSATGLAKRFREERARALIGGCAAHAIMPLDKPLTAALAVVFLLAGHTEAWPVAEGGSHAITKAMASLLESLGGRIETGTWIRSLADLPPARIYLFDTAPRGLAEIAGPVLPARYLRRLGRYRYGPGVFKLDWALDGPIPWRDERARLASTVHVGGTLEELAASERAMWRGDHPERPFVLVVQQSELDPTRAPAGKHTGYGYCHVPHGSTVDHTAAVEAQMERFAPGFRERVLARHAMTAGDFEAYDPAYVGGAITGGVADLFQLFTRPVARLSPYTTPNPRVFLCSASTPPGGGVHGMCGFHAAEVARRRLERFPVAPLA